MDFIGTFDAATLVVAGTVVAAAGVAKLMGAFQEKPNQHQQAQDMDIERDETEEKKDDGVELIRIDNLISKDSFWENEHDAVLLRLNGGVVTPDVAEQQELVKRALQWAQFVEVEEKEVKFLPVGQTSSENQRIFRKDAERTFSSEENRLKLIKILTLCQHEFEDYQQSLSFVVSFLLLTLDETTTVRIARKLNSSKKYIPGHWKGRADGMAINAYVFQHIASTHCPEVVNHLKALSIFPETYTQRWFAGFTVHLSHFGPLFDFFDHVMEEGVMFLFKFGISVFKTLQDEILSTDDISVLYEMLRFEQTCKIVDFNSELISKIVNNASDITLDPSFDLEQEQKRWWEEVVEQKMNAYNNQSGEAEVIEECQLCDPEDAGFIDFYCSDCDMKICEDCHEDEKGDHKCSHNVQDVGEEDEDEEDDQSVDELGADFGKLEVEGK